MPQPARPLWKDWIPAVAMILSLVGALMLAGGYVEQIKQSATDIEDLKHKSEDRDSKLNVIDVRTARIEAKLEVLVPSGKQGPTQ